MQLALIEARVHLAVHGDVGPLTLGHVVAENRGVLNVLGDVGERALLRQVQVLSGVHIHQVVHFARAQLLHQNRVVVAGGLFKNYVESRSFAQSLLPQLHLGFVLAAGDTGEDSNAAGCFGERLSFGKGHPAGCEHDQCQNQGSESPEHSISSLSDDGWRINPPNNPHIIIPARQHQCILYTRSTLSHYG